MSDNMSLKDLAVGAANNEIPTPQENAEREVVNHRDEDTFPTKENNSSTSTTHNGTLNVGGTPVIINKSVQSPPKDSGKTGEEKVENEVEKLMHTPTPSMAGLDEETLNQSSPKIDMSKLGIHNPNNILNPTQSQTDSNGLRPEQMDMLRELTPDMPEDERIKRGVPLLKEFETIMKDLIVNFGLTPEEAKTGAMNRVKNNIKDDYAKYMEANPNLGVITIDKTQDTNDLSLTTEEHKKLEKVHKIRLIMVEDADLANITIERPDEEHKADYVKSIDGSVSKYSVPLPMMGDFVTFKGAQIIQMVNIINYEDARIDEIINNKASLIYEKLVGGSVLKKINESTKDKITYMEFINRFPYQDIDLALYAIVCASAMEESSTSLTCEACSHTWDQKYSTKALLKLDNISDAYKQRVDDILGHKGDEEFLTKLYNDRRKARRFKSPFTSNIYDMSYPTVARATNLLRKIDQNDAVMNYISAIGLYLSRILIYNPSKNSYVEISAEEVDLMLDTLQTLTNEDMNMLANQIRDDFFYRAEFAMEVECPSCHKKSTLPLNIENLIFLMAQDSVAVIEG